MKEKIKNLKVIHLILGGLFLVGGILTLSQSNYINGLWYTFAFVKNHLRVLSLTMRCSFFIFMIKKNHPKLRSLIMPLEKRAWCLLLAWTCSASAGRACRLYQTL